MGSTLNSTVAIVTGASSGIGAATARHLGDNGATVAVVARRKDRLDTLVADIEQSGGTAFAVEADISDRTQADAAVAAVAERFGRLDILINNAGLMLLGPVVGADVDEWDRMISVNVQGLQPFVDLLTRWATVKDATPGQIALAWLLAQRPFIVPIPGTRNIDHLTENLGAINVDLTPAEVQQISTESAALTVYGERMDAANMALVE